MLPLPHFFLRPREQDVSLGTGWKQTVGRGEENRSKAGTPWGGGLHQAALKHPGGGSPGPELSDRKRCEDRNKCSVVLRPLNAWNVASATEKGNFIFCFILISGEIVLMF